MAVLNVIPGTDLKAVDIRDTLNANGGIVNDNFLSYFKWSANINMWSKFKPKSDSVVDIKTADLTDEQHQNVGYDINTNCGGWGLQVVAAVNTSPYQLYQSVLNNQERGVTYRLPKVGTTSGSGAITIGAILRMGDFRRYFAGAVNPISHTFVEGQKIPYTLDYSEIPLTGGVMNIPNSEYQIQVSDIYPKITDSSGKETLPNRGVLILYKGGDYNLDTYLWAIGTLPFYNNSEITAQISGKSVVAFEFFTNAPNGLYGGPSIKSNNNNAMWGNSLNGYWVASSTDPLRNISFASTGGVQPSPEENIATIQWTYEPTFLDVTNNNVRAMFKVKGSSTGGTLRMFYYGLYKDALCLTPIDQRGPEGFTIGANAEKSFGGNFNNPSGGVNCYFGVKANGKVMAKIRVKSNLLDDEA